MTTRQQEIIDNLVNEFNKLQTTESKSFNLINTAPLLDKTRLIEKLEKEEELSRDAWNETARLETRRIAELLSDDLPTLEVSVYGSERRIITITNDTDEINIYVDRRSHYEYNEEVKKSFSVYDGLEFSCYVSGSDKIKYNTIEELLSDYKFLEILRKKLN
jgi:hypothetical protein